MEDGMEGGDQRCLVVVVVVVSNSLLLLFFLCEQRKSPDAWRDEVNPPLDGPCAADSSNTARSPHLALVTKKEYTIHLWTRYIGTLGIKSKKGYGKNKRLPEPWRYKDLATAAGRLCWTGISGTARAAA